MLTTVHLADDKTKVRQEDPLGLVRKAWVFRCIFPDCCIGPSTVPFSFLEEFK